MFFYNQSVKYYTEFEYFFTFCAWEDQGEPVRLKNVKYLLKFLSASGTCETVYGSTDQNGKTSAFRVTENGKLSIFVEGYSSIDSKQKKLITPILVSGPTSIDINNQQLKNNEKFITKAQYDQERINGKRNSRLSYNEYKKEQTNVRKIAHVLKFKSYAKFQFFSKSWQKGISLIQYQIFADGVDKPLQNNNFAKVDKDGYTKVTGHTDSKVFVKYKDGNNDVKTELYAPITCVDPQQIYQIDMWKAKSGISANDPMHQMCLVQADQSRIIVNPHTNEIIVVPLEAYEEFDRQTKVLSDAISSIHKSNAALTKAIQQRNPKEIEELEKRLGLNQQVAIKKINDEFSQPEQITEVWVTQTTGRVNGAAPRSHVSQRYMNQKNYEEIQRKRTLGIPLYDEDPNATQYTAQKKAKFHKVTRDLVSLDGTIGSEEKAVYEMIGGVSGEIAEQYKNSNDVDVSVHAQWLRMTAGSHGKGSINAGLKGVEITAEAQASAKWTLYEGVKEWKKFFPCDTGWKMEVDNYDLGTIRFLIGAELYGFAGANLAISGNLSVDISYEKGKQVARAVSRDPSGSMSRMLDSHNRPKFRPAEGSLERIEANKDNATNQVNAGISAFAGVRTEAILKGALEWFKPSTELGKNGEGEFVTIASVKAGGGVSAGAGAEGKFQIGFSGGYFNISVAAHLCWGIGAKGVLDYQVGYDHMLNYIGFIKLQLLQAGFKALVYIDSRAFSSMAQILAYCIGNDHPLTQNATVLAVGFSKWLEDINKDEERLKAARNTNSYAGRRELIDAMPEAKGILLYGVSHWSDKTAAIFDSTDVKINNGIEVAIKVASGAKFGLRMFVDGETFSERKTAVITILKTCVTQAEWQNTIQHIHPRGKKLSCEQLGRVEGDLIRFLNHGHDPQVAEAVIAGVNSWNYKANDGMSHWLKEYLKYREQAYMVKQTSNSYLIVKNQDDPRFRQLMAQQGIGSGLYGTEYQASNQNILAKFEDSSSEHDT